MMKLIPLKNGPICAKSAIMTVSCNRADMKRKLLTALVFLFAFSLPFNGRACEPILPLFKLLTASSLVGPAVVLNSLLWLFAAVAIKCGAFVLLQRGLSWRKAVVYMLVANVVSTIPGVLVSGMAASMSGIYIALPFIFALGWMVQCRVSRLSQPGPWRRISGGTAALGFIAFFFGSVALYEFAGSALEGRSFASYWLLKFLFVAMVACTGILISAVLEESIIAWLSQKSEENVSFYAPVLRANYLTLAIVLLVAAAEMLPKRLHAPHFIVSWIHSISAMLGLA